MKTKSYIFRKSNVFYLEGDNMLKSILAAMLLILLTGCSNDQGTAQSSQPATGATSASSSATAEAASPFLVFFIDPNGTPCRMQDTILKSMSTELQGKVRMRYVMTTVPEDMNIFYAYGIRALPTILLADSTGKEIKRLTPGVKSADDIRDLLKALPAG
jgi:thioredoxin 1